MRVTCACVRFRAYECASVNVRERGGELRKVSPPPKNTEVRPRDRLRNLITRDTV